jgi:hypothetical protein
MIKLISLWFLFLSSTGILLSGIYFKDYYRELIIIDEQEFLLNSDDRISASRWKNYFARDVEIKEISADVMQILSKNVPSQDVQGFLEKLQKVKYAKLHKINLLADMEQKTFKITAVLALPPGM